VLFDGHRLLPFLWIGIATVNRGDLISPAVGIASDCASWTGFADLSRCFLRSGVAECLITIQSCAVTTEEQVAKTELFIA
jgi:hypothetical protein